MIFVAYKTTDSQHPHRRKRSILQTESATESNLLTEKEVYRKYLDQGIDLKIFRYLRSKIKVYLCILFRGEDVPSSPVQEAVAHAIETSAGIAGGLLWKGNF